jgi:hypothetical protein
MGAQRAAGLCIYFGDVRCLGFYIGQCPMFQKYWRWADECGSFWGKKEKTGLCFYFGEGTMSRFLCWAVANVSKILVMGQSMWLLLKEKKKKSTGGPLPN